MGLMLIRWLFIINNSFFVFLHFLSFFLEHSGNAVTHILLVNSDVFFLQFGFAREEESFHRKDQAAIVHVQFDHFQGQLFAHMEGVFAVLQLRQGQMGDGNKAFHHIVIQRDIHEHAFGDQLGDFAFHFGIYRQLLIEAFPGIRSELLHAERDSVLSPIDGEDNAFHFLPFTEDLTRVIDTLGPADIRDVYQTIDAFFDFHEGAKCGEAFNLTGKHGSDGIAIFDGKPGIGIHLLHTQGDALVFFVQFQHDGIYGITVFEDFSRVGDLLGPAHFTDMNQAFHTGLDLYESSEGLDAHHFTGDASAFRIFDLYIFPWVWNQLFQPQGDLGSLRIKIDHFHFHLIADGQHLGGMIQLSPGHIGEMQQAVNAAQIDKGTVLSDVFDFSIKLGIYLDLAKQLFTFFCGFFFHHGATG